jgi:hypothetical protein
VGVDVLDVAKAGDEVLLDWNKPGVVPLVLGALRGVVEADGWTMRIGFCGGFCGWVCGVFVVVPLVLLVPELCVPFPEF